MGLLPVAVIGACSLLLYAAAQQAPSAALQTWEDAVIREGYAAFIVDIVAITSSKLPAAPFACSDFMSGYQCRPLADDKYTRFPGNGTPNVTSVTLGYKGTKVPHCFHVPSAAVERRTVTVDGVEIEFGVFVSCLEPRVGPGCTRFDQSVWDRRRSDAVPRASPSSIFDSPTPIKKPRPTFASLLRVIMNRRRSDAWPRASLSSILDPPTPIQKRRTTASLLRVIATSIVKTNTLQRTTHMASTSTTTPTTTTAAPKTEDTSSDDSHNDAHHNVVHSATSMHPTVAGQTTSAPEAKSELSTRDEQSSTTSFSITSTVAIKDAWMRTTIEPSTTTTSPATKKDNSAEQREDYDDAKTLKELLMENSIRDRLLGGGYSEDDPDAPRMVRKRPGVKLSDLENTDSTPDSTITTTPITSVEDQTIPTKAMESTVDEINMSTNYTFESDDVYDDESKDEYLEPSNDIPLRGDSVPMNRDIQQTTTRAHNDTTTPLPSLEKAKRNTRLFELAFVGFVCALFIAGVVCVHKWNAFKRHRRQGFERIPTENPDDVEAELDIAAPAFFSKQATPRGSVVSLNSLSQPVVTLIDRDDSGTASPVDPPPTGMLARGLETVYSNASIMFGGIVNAGHAFHFRLTRPNSLASLKSSDITEV